MSSVNFIEPYQQVNRSDTIGYKSSEEETTEVTKLCDVTKTFQSAKDVPIRKTSCQFFLLFGNIYSVLRHPLHSLYLNHKRSHYKASLE